MGLSPEKNRTVTTPLLRIGCSDDPGGPAADYGAVGLLPGSVVVGEGLGYLRPTALTVLSVQTDQLGSGADREQGFDRLIHILAHEVVEVMPMQLDLREPGGLENAAGSLGVAERERSGTTGVGVVILVPLRRLRIGRFELSRRPGSNMSVC